MMFARFSQRRRAGFVVLSVILLSSALLIALFFVARSFSARPATVPIEAEAAKLLIARPGIVAVTRDDLRALGWDQIDLTTLRVKYLGKEQPMRVEGDTLRFYAVISPTRYMSETVYWLERSDRSGARMIEQPIKPRGDLNSFDSYTATARFEEKHVYSPQVEGGDHWFAVQLPAPMSSTFTLTLTAPADGSGQLAIETWASTSAPADPDHRYRLTLNAQVVGEFSWDGKGWHTVVADIPIGLLRDGENVITIEAPGVPNVVADTTFVDRITLEYPRRFVAEHDRLEFLSAGGAQQLTGFSGPIAMYDVTQPDRISYTRLPNTTFAGEAGHHYVAVGPQGARSARVQPAVLSPDLRAARNSADYVAIGPIDLLEPLQPLLQWHTAQGLKTLAVPVEAVFDQFGAGRVDPEAIRSFLQYATQHWAVKPKYVLLVGDASYDTLNVIAPPQANRVPTFWVQTAFGGETASDVEFAQLDDDRKPDVAVGRVPAREAEQIRAWVEKTLAYAQHAPPGEWRTRVLAVADGQEASFRSEAQQFLDHFASDYQSVLVNPPANTPDASEEIRRDFDAGNVIVGYFGHGSVTQWGKDNLFTVKDAAAAQNGDKLPLVINMTCLTGLFTHPKVQSLAETLLWKPEGGAVVLLAPTSLTLASDQSFLSDAVIEAYLKDRTTRIGDIFLQAQRSVPTEDSGVYEVLRTFLLFGDPALKLVR